MKLKDNRLFLRLLTFFAIGVTINILLVGYISILAAYLETYKIRGLGIILDSISQNPLGTLKNTILGTGNTTVMQTANDIYLDIKLQGIAWIVYTFYSYKIIFKKSKRINTIDASDLGHFGKSKLAKPKEIKERFLSTNKGMIVGTHENKICVQEINPDNNQMTLVYGGSGSGKTSGYSIPNVLHISKTLGESFIITDPKADIYNATVRHLQSLGYRVYRINLLDFLKSDRYNPIDYVTTGTEALTLAETLIKNTGRSSSDPFWENAEKSLFASLILYIKETRPKEEHHFGNVLNLALKIGHDQELAEQLFAKLPEDSVAKKLYQIFALAPSDTRNSILLGFAIRLRIWTEVEICKLTAKSDFHIRELGQRKTAVFIMTRDEESTFDVITAMFIDQAFQELTKEARTKGGHLNVPVRMVLDEVANIAPISDLERRVAVMRARGVRIHLIFQGIQQFKNRYGEGIAAEISDSCDNKIILQANDNSTAIPISEMLGNTTILTNSVSQNQNNHGTSIGESYSTQGMALMRPEDILQKDKRKLILIQPGKKSVILDKCFYFEQEEWKNLKEINWAKDDPDRQDEPLHVFRPNSILEPRPQNKVPEQTEQTIEREKPKSKQPKLEQPEEPKQLEQENPKKQTRKREKEPVQIDLFSR